MLTAPTLAKGHSCIACFLSKTVNLRGTCQWHLLSEYRNSKKKGIHIRGTMELAGELDDRWPGSRKRPGREESPDTETAQAVSLRSSGFRAKGNAPGNARGAVVAAAFRGGRCDG